MPDPAGFASPGPSHAFEHLGMSAANGDAEMGVPGAGELPEPLAELGPGPGEGRRADQLGGADLVLLGPEEVA